jgi:hypothetical protein
VGYNPTAGGSRPKPIETDVNQTLEDIDQVSRNADDKIRIATRLKTDANTVLLAVGTSTEDKQLSELALANKKREKQYAFDVHAAALDKLSRK